MSRPPIKLLSFDLDNTLYNNQPVIELAEAKNKHYLATEFERHKKAFNFEHFIAIRNRLINLKNAAPSHQAIKLENLTYLRQQVLQEFCLPLSNREQVVNTAIELFLDYRSKVTLPSPIEQTLVLLAKHYRIVSVSNGNCDPFKTSMGDYLLKHYSPDMGYRAKPHPQMLQLIQQDFSLAPEQILHIGDQIETDGKAAENANCQFYYFAPFSETSSVAESCQGLLDHLNLTLRNS